MRNIYCLGPQARGPRAALPAWPCGVGTRTLDQALLELLQSSCSHPALFPLIRYIKAHLSPHNMENSYSYLHYSGLTLINVTWASARKGATR